VKLTNNHNIPATFVNVIKRPQYSRGDANISVTELLSSPRIVQLRAKHEAETEQDVSEMIWSLFGSAVHNILEHGKDEHHIVEERLFTQFEGWRLSGAIDLQEIYTDGVVISDYKVTGAWSVMQEKDDWVTQLNIYAWLVEKCKNVKVKKIQIVGIVRDWQARDAATREGYPSSPVAVLEMPLWPFEEREAYIKTRIHLHNDAYFASKTGLEFAECTPAEMWEKPTIYAVRKIGGVRAKALYGNKEEAQEALAALNIKKPDYEIEVRDGERTRCARYCQVSKFCTQNQEYLKTHSIEEQL